MEYSNHGDLSCGPQGSILGSLIFLLDVNAMAQAVKCDLLLYAYDSCFIFRGKKIKNKLNINLISLCDWFIENKLSFHFGEDKTKFILISQ